MKELLEEKFLELKKKFLYGLYPLEEVDKADTFGMIWGFIEAYVWIALVLFVLFGVSIIPDF
tara:strand:- start:372 stop:557 length:186 start_codon:yes stop_codon:yes gene_type:complete